MYPENNSVFDLLNSADDPEDPTEFQTNEDSPENQQNMGPHQGGATGIPTEEQGLQENHLMQPVQENEIMAQAVEQHVRDAYGEDNDSSEQQEPTVETNEDGVPVAPWPPRGKGLSDYNTPSIQAMAFPTLFPYGTGDVTQKVRDVDVTMTDANEHLLKYAVERPKDSDLEGYFYPFVEHDRWMHWAQNTAERHRINLQKNVYLQQHPEDANLTFEEIAEILKTDIPRFYRILGRMQKYNANINGSNGYYFSKRKELEAISDQRGAPSLWCSFSAADNHWSDMHRSLYPYAKEFANEEEAAKFRRMMARDNPHLVDAYFFKRIQTMFDTYFGPKALEVDWWWYRGELQGRGCYHVHGCMRLKKDPGLTDLGKLVVKGRFAQYIY